jgi:hypothetical protein
MSTYFKQCEYFKGIYVGCVEFVPTYVHSYVRA